MALGVEDACARVVPHADDALTAVEALIQGQTGERMAALRDSITVLSADQEVMPSGLASIVFRQVTELIEIRDAYAAPTAETIDLTEFKNSGLALTNACLPYTS